MRLEFSIYRFITRMLMMLAYAGLHHGSGRSRDMMLLDALIQLKRSSLSFAAPAVKVCAVSDDLNMNGKNGLACITPISALNQPGKKIVIRPLPGLPVIRDLVVNVGQFYAQYEKIKPYL